MAQVTSPTITISVSALPTYNLTLSASNTSPVVNEVITLSGILTRDGIAVSGAAINILINGTSMGTATTTGAGAYSIPTSFSAAGSYSVQAAYIY